MIRFIDVFKVMYYLIIVAILSDAVIKNGIMYVIYILVGTTCLLFIISVIQRIIE